MSRKHYVIILTLGILCVGFILLILVMNGLKIYCPFNLVTGLNCPGCGNTRTVIALFQLDFLGMLHYNLMFPFQILYIAWVYFVSAKNYINGKRFSYNTRSKILDIAFLVLLVVWTIVRNCTELY